MKGVGVFSVSLGREELVYKEGWLWSEVQAS